MTIPKYRLETSNKENQMMEGLDASYKDVLHGKSTISARLLGLGTVANDVAGSDGRSIYQSLIGVRTRARQHPLAVRSPFS